MFLANKCEDLQRVGKSKLRGRRESKGDHYETWWLAFVNWDVTTASYGISQQCGFMRASQISQFLPWSMGCQQLQSNTAVPRHRCHRQTWIFQDVILPEELRSPQRAAAVATVEVQKRRRCAWVKYLPQRSQVQKKNDSIIQCAPFQADCMSLCSSNIFKILLQSTFTIV